MKLAKQLCLGGYLLTHTHSS